MADAAWPRRSRLRPVTRERKRPGDGADRTYPLDPTSRGIGSAPTLPDYRRADPVPFVNTLPQYTVVQKSQATRTALACHYLERYERYLEDHRADAMVKRWAPWAGVVIGDFVAQGHFINGVVAIEASRAAR